MERGRTGENYILGGADSTYAEAIRIVGELLKRPIKVRVARPILLRVAGRVFAWTSRWHGREPLVTPESAAFLCSSLVCRSDKAVRELGYRPVPLRTMLEDCYRWMVAEGLLKAG